MPMPPSHATPRQPPHISPSDELPPRDERRAFAAEPRFITPPSADDAAAYAADIMMMRADAADAAAEDDAAFDAAR